jgi:acyl-CoA thioesterase
MRADAPLNELVSSTRVAPGRYAIDFAQGWQQGRGLFGGLVLGALVRAMTSEVNDGQRPLRSLTGEIPGPVQPGPAELVVETLRAGSGVSTLAARLVQGGEVLAHAVGVFGKTRAVERDGVYDERPVLPPWREAEVVPVAPPFGPDFAVYWEFRNTGPFPMSGAEKPETSGWVRPKNPGAVRDGAFVTACADACWPSLFVMESMPRPMATIAFTLELLEDPSTLPLDAPLFHRARHPVIRGGYAVEFRELWSEDGRLVAMNQQTMALIK